MTPERIDEIERTTPSTPFASQSGTREIDDDKLHELIFAARELMNWREAARVAAEEPCEGERHCACVPPLRARVKELEDQHARPWRVRLDTDDGRLECEVLDIGHSDRCLLVSTPDEVVARIVAAEDLAAMRGARVKELEALLPTPEVAERELAEEAQRLDETERLKAENARLKAVVEKVAAMNPDYADAGIDSLQDDAREALSAAQDAKEKA